MKRTEIEAILNNADLDAGARLDQIMTLHGKDATAWQQERATLTQERDDARAKGETFKDYDDIVKERDELKAYKADRESGDRFSAVVGGAKFRNSYTEKGVKADFLNAVNDEANKGKTDEDIYAAIVKGHENEYFEGKVNIIMPKPSDGGAPKSDIEAYLDQRYKDNPYYKKN